MSMKRILPFILLALSGYAEDFTLADGTVLKEAKVLHRSDEELQIFHSGGIEKFSYKELGEELQKRYEMTPEQVLSRKDAAKKAVEDARKARETQKAEKERALQEEQHARAAALEASGKYARYYSGAEVMQLCSSLLTIEARAAEFLAAEWNRREALRLGLGLDAQRFSAEVASLRADFEQDRKELANLRSELSDKRAKVKEQAATIKRKNQEIEALQAQVAALNKALGRAQAENTSTDTTVVIDRPVYVPVGPTCVGHTVLPGHKHPRRHKPAAPHRHKPKPIQVSPGPKPAGSAHTLPRR